MRVDCTNYTDATARILRWSREKLGAYVCVANTHSLIEARDRAAFRALLNRANLVTPDGMPLVWTLRARGFRQQQRVYGPTLCLHLWRAAAGEGLPIGLYGGSAKTIDRLATRIAERFPGIRIPYAYAPPYRELTDDESQAVVSAIAESGARILFVGLGCPKQELWMAAHRDRIAAVMVGVGAAFDIHAGTLAQAPSWMQSHGLEWAYRLSREPRRLWRRYLNVVPRFAVLSLWETIRGGWRHDADS